MAMAVQRPHGGAVLSGVRGKTPGSFDMRSWQGLTEILKAGREAGMDAETYADFRDAVLQYAQSGGTDSALRGRIEKAVAAFGIHITSDVTGSTPTNEKRAEKKITVSSAAKAESASLLGASRPIPDFSSKGVIPPVTPPKVAEPKTVAFAPQNLPIAPKATETEISQKPVVPTSPPKKAKEAAKQEPQKQERSSAPTPQFSTLGEYRARISEIKQMVNAHVGNPVGLMSGGNPAGREYMAALVGAMKAVSGGAPGTLMTAMQKLEDASKQVLDISPEVLTQKKQEESAKPKEKKEATVKKSEENRTSPVEKAAPQKEAPRVPSQEKATPIPSKAPQPKKAEAKQTPPAQTIADVLHLRSIQGAHGKIATPRAQHTIPSLGESIAARSVAPKVPKEPPLKKIPPVKKPPAPITQVPKPKPKKAVQETPQVPPPPKTPPVTPIQKVAKPTPIKPLQVSPPPKPAVKPVPPPPKALVTPQKAAPIVKEGAGEDLNTPAINAGLAQLLGEWKLFSGAGLFGRGPSGYEHPLFRQLAKLPMSAIAAGRWENADKETILSIRDYMSAWRHEQGIAYSPGETFEHYLRRVVKRILKRQGL